MDAAYVPAAAARGRRGGRRKRRRVRPGRQVRPRVAGGAPSAEPAGRSVQRRREVQEVGGHCFVSPRTQTNTMGLRSNVIKTANNGPLMRALSPSTASFCGSTRPPAACTPSCGCSCWPPSCCLRRRSSPSSASTSALSSSSLTTCSTGTRESGRSTTPRPGCGTRCRPTPTSRGGTTRWGSGEGGGLVRTTRLWKVAEGCE